MAKKWSPAPSLGPGLSPGLGLGLLHLKPEFIGFSKEMTRTKARAEAKAMAKKWSSCS